MKTQIKTLINGYKNVIRDLSAEKYATAPKSTSHNDFAGSNAKTRAEIAAKVFAENGDTMTATIRGVKVTLKRDTSTSGKTAWYAAELSEDQYKAICGYTTATKIFESSESRYSIRFNGDCTVTARAFARKTPGSAWKERLAVDIGEEFVTIEEDDKLTLRELMSQESADRWIILPSNYEDKFEDELNAEDHLDCNVHDWYMSPDDNVVEITVLVDVK